MQARVAAAIASEEVLARVAARLKEERAKLEERVTRQLDMERKQLLERKRREDAERRQAQAEMERIIQENKRKVRRSGSLPGARGWGGVGVDGTLAASARCGA